MGRPANLDGVQGEARDRRPGVLDLEGKPLLASYCRNLFKRLGKKAGLGKRTHPHGLRHRFAAGLADKKVDIRIISKALGHSSLSTTQTYVDHLRPTAVIDVLKARSWGRQSVPCHLAAVIEAMKSRTWSLVASVAI